MFWQYETTKDHILCRKGALSKEDCDYYINYFESNKLLQRPGKIGAVPEVVTRFKDDTEMYFTLGETDLNLRPLNDVLAEVSNSYRKKYPYTEKVFKWGFCPRFKIQRYYPGQGYHVLHCENQGISYKDPNMSKRLLAWMIYLNDVKDGGYTEFPSQRIKFQPRRGDLLIWPAHFTHPHKGIVSKTQTKYIMTGWFNYKKDASI